MVMPHKLGERQRRIIAALWRVGAETRREGLNCESLSELGGVGQGSSKVEVATVGREVS